MPYLPNSEKVAVAWCQQVPGFDNTMIGTTLPKPAVFAANGFVTVAVVGGSIDTLSGERAPVIQCTAHATNPDSDKPPWGKSVTLLERIASYTEAVGDWEISLGPLFDPVVVRSVFPTGEIRRLQSATFASYSLDVVMIWTRKR